MCILFAYVSSNPGKSGYQLIIASNRDEEFTRPAIPAHWWTQRCISGLDAEPGKTGGTWIGLSTRGKVGVLLNIMGSREKNKRGRGHLVQDYLTFSQSGQDYLRDLEIHKDQYNGFNLVLFEFNRATSRWVTWYYSNKDPASPTLMEEEIIGFGNSVLHNEFLKVTHGKEKFASIIKQSQSTTELTDGMLQFLKDGTRYWPDPHIVQQASSGQHPPQILQQLSSVYVDCKQFAYGTRTHTVIVIDAQGQGTFTESTMLCPIDPENPQWHTSSYSVTVASSLPDSLQSTTSSSSSNSR